jgi:glutathione synthase/RimK-type ligase-like ATP-grasp enzyme
VTLDVETTGWVDVRGRRLPLDDIHGIYLRPGEARGRRALAASTTLLAVASSLPATVVNRPTAGRSNWSKPFQLGLLRAAGLAVPDTLVTTDPAAARAFLHRHGRVVYKSVSGVRSIVASLGPGDADRLDAVTTGPVQLQQWIRGLDVRVHVIGDRWFATAVDSPADDYRYGALDGHEPAMTAYDLPDGLGCLLVGLARSMGLLVAGADLRVTPEGTWFAFEVNPSPGFTFYEDATGQPIAPAIAELLCR